MVKIAKESKSDLEKRWEGILSFRLKNPKDAEKIESEIKELRKAFKLRKFKS